MGNCLHVRRCRLCSCIDCRSGERKLRGISLITLGVAMSRRAQVPDKPSVLGALAELSAETAQTGKRPSVVALAQRLGLSNTTFWRHYPDIAREVATTAVTKTALASRTGVKIPDANWRSRTQSCGARSACLTSSLSWR